MTDASNFPQSCGFICSDYHAWAAVSRYPHKGVTCPHCGEPGIWMPSGWWSLFIKSNMPRTMHCMVWRSLPLRRMLHTGVVKLEKTCVEWTDYVVWAGPEDEPIPEVEAIVRMVWS